MSERRGSITEREDLWIRERGSLNERAKFRMNEWETRGLIIEREEDRWLTERGGGQ